VRSGRVPVSPSLARHVTAHRIDCVDVTGWLVADRYRYAQPPLVGWASPSAEVQARPGPAQETGADPSPGSKLNAVGVTVTVADTPPARTVAECVRHDAASVQNQVHRFT
jgi:hypothetical protein